MCHTMKALVKFGKGIEGIELRDIPEPTPKANELKLKVLSVGICGTDIHIMNDEYPYNAPVVMGHEYIGVVADMGKDVKDFKIGERVVSLTSVYTCGHCVYCGQGLRMLCAERKSIGSGLNGAMAEYMVVPSDLAYHIPPEAPYGEELAMCEPLACCVRAVQERSIVRAGDIVLVSGPGTIGQLCAQLCKMQGARVIVSGTEKDVQRLKVAKSLGADVVVQAGEALKEAVYSISPLGVDIALECAGAAPSASACVELLKKQGNYTQVALYKGPIPFDLNQFLFKELTLHTTYAQEPTSWERLMSILSTGKLVLEPLFDNTLSIDDWKAGFDRTIALEGFKTALRPS